MILVLLESPYAGSVEENVRYARACMHDCFERGEAPYASHLLYTQPGVLDDDDPDERAKGIEAGLLWGAQAEKTVVYVDRGISGGVIQGIKRADAESREVVFRSLKYKEEYSLDEIKQSIGYAMDGMMATIGRVFALKDI